jgi:hypothetical protein
MSDFFICKNIGQTDNGIRIEQRYGADGTPYFCASAKIVLFSVSVPEKTPGPTLEEFGTTAKEARERLDKKLRDFNDSLWL